MVHTDCVLSAGKGEEDTQDVNLGMGPCCGFDSPAPEEERD